MVNTSKEKTQRKRYILDTNVFRVDPDVVFRFENNDVHIPLIVLDELDRQKNIPSARKAIKILHDILYTKNGHKILDGIPITTQGESRELDTIGRLFFQNIPSPDSMLKGCFPDTSVADNQILAYAMELKEKYSNQQVVIVTRDINFRNKCAIYDVLAEDYRNDLAVPDLDLLPSGLLELPEDFWEKRTVPHAGHDKAGDFEEVYMSSQTEWTYNQGLYVKGDTTQLFKVESIDKSQQTARLRRLKNYNGDNKMLGIVPLNIEQRFALNLLLDPEIEFVGILGAAGTGKTLLALAAGLHLVMDTGKYKKIIITRATVPIGKDIGATPGDEEKKMGTWMGCVTDNLEVIVDMKEHTDNQKKMTLEYLRRYIQVVSLSRVRGRSIHDAILILDEAQNFYRHEIVTLITRAGRNTKVIVLGNWNQIDVPDLTPPSCGVVHAISRLHGWEGGGHVFLKTGERSRLSNIANKLL